MCPHCLTAFGQCPHCRGADKPLRPPTQASIAAFKAAETRHGVQKSSLTNAERVALGIFPKPWRGVAREAGYNPKPAARAKSPAPGRRFNTVLPANFTL
jgi:hypothetical protein